MPAIASLRCIWKTELSASQASQLPQKSRATPPVAAVECQRGCVLLILICGPRQPRWPQVGTVERVNRQGCRFSRASVPECGHAEPRRGTEWWGKAFFGYFLGVCKKVTRCKSGTISRRYLNNGYAPSNHYRASTMAKYPNTVSKMPDTAYATGKPIQGTLLSISLAASRAGPEWLRAPATPPMRIAGLILNT